MKQIALMLCTAFLLTGLAVAGDAEMVTVEGTVLCAKCTLHVEGLDECQNVLIVNDGDEKQQYFLTKNEVAVEYGDVCMATPTVRVTGTLSEEDGQTWLAATEIEAVDEEG